MCGMFHRHVNDLLPFGIDKVDELVNISPNSSRQRTALQLKTAYSKWRSEHTAITRRYEASGQGMQGSEVFYSFCTGSSALQAVAGALSI